MAASKPASGLLSTLSRTSSSLKPVNEKVARYLSLLLNGRRATIPKRMLQILLGLWLASRVNRALNMWARNHWCIRKPGQPWDFSGDKELAVVTGGSSGFGLLIAKGLSAHCRVAVLDVQYPPEELQECSNITFYHCDLTSASAIHDTADAIRRDLGDPSILVNNAGIVKLDRLVDKDDDFLNGIFKVNVISHFILIKEFLPVMLKQQKGHIISIASVGSYMSGPRVVDYSATKAGVLALYEGLNGELRQNYKPNGRCIQTTIVHPGPHETEMMKSLRASGTTNCGRLLPPNNVADAVISQILRGRGNQIFTPSSGTVISFLRALPSWLQELIRDCGVGSW